MKGPAKRVQRKEENQRLKKGSSSELVRGVWHLSSLKLALKR